MTSLVGVFSPCRLIAALLMAGFLPACEAAEDREVYPLQEVASVALEDAGTPTAFAVNGRTAYLATATGKQGLLHVISMAPAGEATRVRVVRLARPATAIAAEGRRAWLALRDPNSEIHELISGRHGPCRIRPAYDLPGARRVEALAAHGGRLYVGTTRDPAHDELLVLDVDDLGARGRPLSVDLDADVVSLDASDAVLDVALRGSRIALRVPNLVPTDSIETVASGFSGGEKAGRDPSFPFSFALSRTSRSTLVFTILRSAPRLSIADRNHDGRLVLGCMGDSNTVPHHFDHISWCELLDEWITNPAFSVVNVARAGATAVETSRRNAYSQLPAMLAAEPDVVVMAFGTNDTGLRHAASPEKIAAAYREVGDALRGLGIEVLVALTPPRFNFPDVATRAANERLVSEYGSEQLLDFYSTVDSSDFERDGFHVRQSGQIKRARVAFRRLTRERRPARSGLVRAAIVVFAAGGAFAFALALLGRRRTARRAASGRSPSRISRSVRSPR